MSPDDSWVTRERMSIVVGDLYFRLEWFRGHAKENKDDAHLQIGLLPYHPLQQFICFFFIELLVSSTIIHIFIVMVVIWCNKSTTSTNPL